MSKTTEKKNAEESIPTTLEEHILKEYYTQKTELDLTKDQLSMTKRALDTIATELTKLKEVISRYGTKIDPREKFPYLHVNLSCWGTNDEEYPDYMFMKKYFPIKEEQEPKKEDSSE